MKNTNRKYSLTWIIYTLSWGALMMILFSACDKVEPITDVTQFPRVKVDNPTFSENALDAAVIVSLTWAYTQEVSVDFVVKEMDDKSALEDNDFLAIAGTLVFAPGETSKQVSLTIIDDLLAESDEQFIIELSNPIYARLLNISGVITITNDDTQLIIDDAGYVAPEVYQGYQRVWEEDFSGEVIDQSIWGYNIGGDGWGNNELQYYTDRSTNSFQTGGYLLIEAKKEKFAENDYTSARLLTRDKYEFQYGRIDIRAKLPKGKGIWPALWMLGADFDVVGWPRCGEIDIMELIGSQPKIVHGTAHYFGSSQSHEFKGASTFLSGGGDFSDEFHVFSTVWREDLIEWYVDGKFFFSLRPSDVGGADWPFNDKFFFIMNVAVGGNWPGSPDASTNFPQRMIVDYIRHYQLN